MSKQKKKLLSYLGLAALAFLVMVAHLPVVSNMKFTAVDTMSLPMRIISFPFWELKKILYYHHSFAQSHRLEKEAGMLRQRLTTMDEVVRQNDRLEKLLNFKQKATFKTLAVNVIARDLSNWNAAVLIDKGNRSGISTGMPVVDSSGVIGKVVEVGTHRSKVILISDPSFSVPAMVKRSREVGLVSGTLTGQCRMRYISADADVQVGDEIISSKLSSSFPEGLLLGVVMSVENPQGGRTPFPSYLIKPSAPLSQIEEVLVILSST